MVNTPYAYITLFPTYGIDQGNPEISNYTVSVGCENEEYGIEWWKFVDCIYCLCCSICNICKSNDQADGNKKHTPRNNVRTIASVFPISNNGFVSTPAMLEILLTQKHFCWQSSCVTTMLFTWCINGHLSTSCHIVVSFICVHIWC